MPCRRFFGFSAAQCQLFEAHDREHALIAIWKAPLRRFRHDAASETASFAAVVFTRHWRARALTPPSSTAAFDDRTLSSASAMRRCGTGRANRLGPLRRRCRTGRLGRESQPQPALGDFTGCSKRRPSNGRRSIFRLTTDYSCRPWATDSRRNADPGRGLISVGLLCSGPSASSLLRASCP